MSYLKRELPAEYKNDLTYYIGNIGQARGRNFDVMLLGPGHGDVDLVTKEYVEVKVMASQNSDI